MIEVSEQLVMMVRAINQTVEMGSEYIAIPVPWWEQYASFGWQYQSHAVNWAERCMWVGENPPMDETGDVILCLRPDGHRGECGGPGRTRQATS